MTHRILPFLALALAASLAPAPRTQQPGKITVLERDAGGIQTIRVFDESAPAQPGQAFLSGVTLLPIDKTQRTSLSDLAPDRSRRVTRRGVTSIDLPGGGRVLHFARANRTVFGYLLIQANGEPVVLLEQNGTGPGNQTDPFAAQVGVAPQGQHAAFLMTTGAIYLARLDGASYASTGTPARQVWNGFPTPEEKSLSPGSTALFFVTEDERIRRCGLGDSAPTLDVTPAGGGAGARLDDELAMSGDGAQVAFLYGPRDQESIWLLAGAGSARRLAPPPSKYEEAGYLPDTPDGPSLLLDETGARLLYIDSLIRDEIFVTETAVGGATTHITSNANFLPYIGVTIIPAFTASELMIAVGDPGAFDYFAATPATPLVNNLTQTGPNLSPPFDTGTLVPTAGVQAMDETLVTFEAAGGGATRVRALDPLTGTDWTATRTLRAPPATGSGFGPAASFWIGGQEGDVLIDATTGGPILATPPGIELSTEVGDASGTLTLFVARLTNGPTQAAALLLRAGPILATLDVRTHIEEVGITTGNGILVDDGALTYYGPNGATAVLSSAAAVTLLSGAIN